MAAVTGLQRRKSVRNAGGGGWAPQPASLGQRRSRPSPAAGGLSWDRSGSALHRLPATSRREGQEHNQTGLGGRPSGTRSAATSLSHSQQEIGPLIYKLSKFDLGVISEEKVIKGKGISWHGQDPRRKKKKTRSP